MKADHAVKLPVSHHDLSFLDFGETPKQQDR